MKIITALALIVTLSACNPSAPADGGAEPAPDCAPGAEFCAD